MKYLQEFRAVYEFLVSCKFLKDKCLLFLIFWKTEMNFLLYEFLLFFPVAFFEKKVQFWTFGKIVPDLSTIVWSVLFNLK